VELPSADCPAYGTPSMKFQSYCAPTEAAGMIALRYFVLALSPKPATEIWVSAS
jgi:hypothetical protein